MLSTTQKGNEFEDAAYAEIKELLDSGDLGLISDRCRSYQKKGYYSKDRDSNIIVDISIEVWMPNEDVWSMLWVCECKNCSATISMAG
jgi:hypothetical protein